MVAVWSRTVRNHEFPANWGLLSFAAEVAIAIAIATNGTTIQITVAPISAAASADALDRQSLYHRRNGDNVALELEVRAVEAGGDADQL